MARPRNLRGGRPATRPPVARLLSVKLDAEEAAVLDALAEKWGEPSASGVVRRAIREAARD